MHSTNGANRETIDAGRKVFVYVCIGGGRRTRRGSCRSGMIILKHEPPASVSLFVRGQVIASDAASLTVPGR